MDASVEDYECSYNAVPSSRRILWTKAWKKASNDIELSPLLVSRRSECLASLGCLVHQTSPTEQKPLTA